MSKPLTDEEGELVKIDVLAKHAELRLTIEAAKALTNMIGMRPHLLPELWPRLRDTLECGPARLPDRAPPKPIAWRLKDATVTDPAAMRGELAPREHDVVRLLSEGFNRNEMADVLGVSPNTVRTHSMNLYSRLGACSAGHAVGLAYRKGILS